jgi:predicted aspartyl protease
MDRARRPVAAFAVALFLASARPCAAEAQRFDLPPAGLVPASATLAEVLAHLDAAAGEAPQSAGERWTFTSGGVTGTERDLTRGTDYRIATQFGPFSYERGERNGRAWRRNANGLTILLRASKDRDAPGGLELRDARGSRNGVRLLGEATNPAPAYVLAIAPANGRQEWLFVDKTSGLVTRTEFAYPDRRVVVTADDFRTTGGVTRAFHLRASDTLSAANDADWRLTEYQPDLEVSGDDLDIPQNDHALAALPQGAGRTLLPARFVDGHVYLESSVAGRSAYLMLDSGTSDIVLDRAFASRIGLTEYGKTAATGAGSYVQSQVLIPSIAIGKVRLQNVAAYDVPFHYRAGGFDVAGLLGFDFFAGAIVHVDYLHERVELLDPATYDPAAGPGAISVPLALDDGLPIAAARIGAGTSAHFIIDTGSSNVVLYSRFARAHPKDVADAGAGTALQRYLPSITASAVGGTLKLVPLELKTLTFARNSFHDFIVERVEGAPSFENADADGLIGYEFLHYFDLYFDYGGNRMILFPNQWMQRARANAPM